MSSGTTAVVLNDFNEKGVIEIIFIDEILAKFLCCEGDSSSATSWFVQPHLASYIPFGVGYCFIQQQRQCEKPHQQDKAVSSHTFILY